jgi:DNA end-binding protein Ku
LSNGPRGYGDDMAPRSIWNGTITLGLVSVPIKLYSATESKTVRFREVHAKDGAAIEHRRVCSKEVSPGRFVVLEKDEIKAAAGDRGKVIHLTEFVDAHEIDPIFYEKTYYVGSRDDADPYRLLFEVLRKTERAGIGRFSFHDREYLVAVRALDDVLALHTLRFADEVVSATDLEIPRARQKPSDKEIKMADRLVSTLEEKFDPTAWEDTYRAAVLDLIKRKAKGDEIDLAAEEEPAHGEDLEAALQASIGGR